MKDKILNVVSVLFALMFLNGGLNKIFNYMPVPDDLPENMVQINAAFAQISWLMPLVAVVEIVGGLLVILPKTRALGAIIIFPIMVGIMLLHLVDFHAGLPMAIPFFLVNIWMLWGNRAKYLPMIS